MKKRRNNFKSKSELVKDVVVDENLVKTTYEKAVIHKLINFDKKEENIQVSIIIPVCNVERYLRECLDSAINQTLKEIEIICVNDGSTDGSLEILEEYAHKDSRVKVIDKENSGYGHVMNLGMDMASGEFIGIIESDDYVEPNMFERLLEVAVENNLDFVKSDFYRFYGDGDNRIKEYNKVARIDENYNVIFNPSSDHKVFQFLMNTWSGLYRTSFLRDNNIRHNETPGASFQDNGFWFKCNVCGKRMEVINEAFYMNRRDNPDSSVYNPQKVYCGNIEYDYIYEYLQKNGILKDFIEVFVFKKFHTYKFTIDRIADEFKKEYIRNISIEFNEMKKKGELVSRFLSNKDWDMIRWIMRDPDEYYYMGLRNEIIVSVILPVYNVAQYLDQCLYSIENQTMKKIEIICIDDGSTDGSLDIIKEHQNKDHRIRIVTQKNSGAGKARNEGMKIARGKYLSFLDADDFIDKDTYKLAVNRAEANDADITIYKAYLYDNNTKTETPNNFSVKMDKLPKTTVFSKDTIKENIFTNIMGWAWDKLYKASFVYNTGLKFQEQRTTNDMYFVYATLLKAPRITILDKRLYHQRRNVSTSLSNTREKSWDCFYQALVKVKDELMNSGVYEKYERDFVNYALHSCLWNFNTLKDPAAGKLFIKLRESWFENLGINGRDQDFFINKKEYNQYMEIISLPLYDSNAYFEYRLNALMIRNEFADLYQKVKISDKEILTVEQLVEKLKWNRAQVANKKVKITDKETLTIEQLVEKLKWNREQVANLKKEVNKSKIKKMNVNNGYDINEVMNSMSYKIGHVITFIPRWIRHIFTGKSM